MDSSGSVIVCFGDSITAGVGAGRGEGYPARLGEELGVEVVAKGVPGDTAGAAVRRVDEVLAEDPWLVIVELGGNDLLRQAPVETTEAELGTIVERLLAAGTVPMLVEVEAPFAARYGDMFDRLEDRYGVPAVEGSLGRILLDPALKSDPIHPNAAGYAELARAVAERVRPLIAERRRRGLPVERAAREPA